MLNMARTSVCSYNVGAICFTALMIEISMSSVIGNRASEVGLALAAPWIIFLITKWLVGSSQLFSLCLYAIADMIEAMETAECEVVR